MRRIGIVIFILGTLCGACGKGKHGRLERADKLICDTNNRGTVLPSKLELTASQAESWGAAFEASGNCDATVSNPEFRSPKVALSAGGNSRLVIEGGILEGGEHAIVVSGNAQVEIRGTVIIGKIKKSGQGKVTGMETAKDAEEAEGAEVEQPAEGDTGENAAKAEKKSRKKNSTKKKRGSK